MSQYVLKAIDDGAVLSVFGDAANLLNDAIQATGILGLPRVIHARVLFIEFSK